LFTLLRVLRCFPLALLLLFEFPLRSSVSSVVAGVAFFVPLWLSDFGLGLLELEASSFFEGEAETRRNLVFPLPAQRAHYL